jgi:deoxyhypusine synthase
MSDHKNPGHNSKKDFLKNPVEHIDITSFDSRKIISSMEKNVFCVKRNS